MKTVINVEEKIGKTVGKRRPPADSLAYASDLNESQNQFRKKLGVRGFPRGVYKFKTHEEANEWEIKMAVMQSRENSTKPKS